MSVLGLYADTSNCLDFVKDTTTSFLCALFMMYLGALYPVGGAMSVSTYRRYYARTHSGWYLSIFRRLCRDLRSRVPRGLQVTQTGIASVSSYGMGIVKQLRIA
jgi:hypothetical protein